MKIKRKIIEIDEERCDGCGQCAIACAEGAIVIEGGKARLISDNYCDGLGACLGECPQDAIRMIERDAEDFDPVAVEHHLEARERATKPAAQETMPCGCPSNQIKILQPRPVAGPAPGAHSPPVATPSQLSHWPVQIRLVPAKAPFLKGADLLVAADCAPVAYPDFHRDFLKDKVVLIGCPKFDDVPQYVEKFTEIFKLANVRSVTVLVMEVPCCSGLPMIVRKAMAAAGKQVPMEEVVIGAQGQILKRQEYAA
ncbi:MAG TPA: 4Fe-4S ferredoxin [Syntrophobacteraceae bacterium]|nr:4Fe-4S ferredoxin [Syntrophobacteraceae bacterium]HBD07924.1 4Fe-4S ferredoxin [Syntrophobacteraceae bacterium]